MMVAGHIDNAFTTSVVEPYMRSVWVAAAPVVAMVAVLVPAGANAAYWGPGSGAAPETHSFTICDTIRQVCYEADLEFIVSVLHEQTPYWVVRADMTILAGFPPGMVPPAGVVAEPYRINGEPLHDMDLLDDSVPPGIPASTYALLYDGKMHSPFVDQSRTLVDSLGDTLFGLNDLMNGSGLVRVGETWGEVVVIESIDGLYYLVEYVGEGSASFLVDPFRPIPVAGIYRADRYDPHIGSSMWFYAEREHMEMLLGLYERAGVDVSGPDNVMRAGTLSGLSWSSDTYQVQSLTTAPDQAVIRGHASSGGTLQVVMPAFGGSYTFWQDGTLLPAEYEVAGGVLSARIVHGEGEITIHSIPDDVCTGDCLDGLVVRAWSGSSAIVYGGGFHGAVRMSMASGDPDGVAALLCPPGSAVTVDFDVMEHRRVVQALPYATTYESNLDVSMTRDGSAIRVAASGEPAALTLRMPAMTGKITYTAGGLPIEPLAESTWYDTVTATLEHSGGAVEYVINADGPTAWKGGLAIPPPTDRTGAIWCGMAEPVNAAVIRDAGVNRQDCGVTKFDRGWNVWC